MWVTSNHLSGLRIRRGIVFAKIDLVTGGGMIRFFCGGRSWRFTSRTYLYIPKQFQATVIARIIGKYVGQFKALNLQGGRIAL